MHWMWVPIYARCQPFRLPVGIFSVSGEMVLEKWQAATYATLGHPWIFHPMAKMHGDIAYSRWVLLPFPNGL